MSERCVCSGFIPQMSSEKHLPLLLREGPEKRRLKHSFNPFKY